MSAQQIAALKARARGRGISSMNALSVAFSSQKKFEPGDSPQSPGNRPTQCICNRELQDILCRSCGYCFVGRVRKKCLVHPNEILLMDSSCCPQCKTVYLLEIKSSDTPVKKQLDELDTELISLRERRDSGDRERRGSGDQWLESGVAAGRKKRRGSSSDLLVGDDTLTCGEPGQGILQPIGRLFNKDSKDSASVLKMGTVAESGSKTKLTESPGRSVLENALKRNGMQDWENGMEKMNELCIGEKR